MNRDAYFDAPALSNSAMKDLAISPYRYWYHWLNPDRPARPSTPEMTFGSALHCKALEPDQFTARYAPALDASLIDGCLVTVADLRTWADSHGFKLKGNLKAELIAQVQAATPDVPIFDVLQARHAEETASKTTLKQADWARVLSCAAALQREPKFTELMRCGEAEYPMFATDPELGVPLKARMDWASDVVTLDLKTFSQQRGASIDKTVTNAIWYEGYYIQAYFYSFIRSLQPGFSRPGIAALAPPFILAFVESEEPHEVRLRVLRPKAGGEVNMLWERARLQVRGLIRLYAHYWETFGTSPWRESRDLEDLCDEEFPQIAYGI
jgi:hypothetical protein